MFRTALPAFAGVTVCVASFSPAAVPVIGGPPYDAATGTGYQAFTTAYYEPADAIAGDGTALATLSKYAGGTAGDAVPVLYTAGGFTAFTAPAMAGSGRAIASVAERNAAGVAVGQQTKVVPTSNFYPSQAVRWDTPGRPVVLADGISGTMVASYAAGVDPKGTVVGTSTQFAADASGFVENTIERPVRWAAGTTAATPLDVAAASGRTAGYNSGMAAGIAADGTTYGTVESYEEGDHIKGNFGLTAVRWAAGGTAFTELAHAAAPAGGSVEDYVTRVRPNGVLSGKTEITSATGGSRSIPTRWAADGSVTVLDMPSYAVENGFNSVLALSDTGEAAGRVATKTSGSDGFRPVRWDAGTSAVTSLGLLGTPTATTSAWALGVNDAGVAVGVQRARGNDTDGTALLWGADGVAVDLNTLIDPASGWRLIEADSITDAGYVAGVGMFDPDGGGPLAAYTRSFLIQAVPEPATLAVAGVLAVGVLRRRRA